MKQTYEAPVAEKIRFQYAEQVAASAGDIGGGTEDNSGGSSGGGSTTPGWDDVIKYLLDTMGICQNCSSLLNLLN